VDSITLQESPETTVADGVIDIKSHQEESDTTNSSFSRKSLATIVASPRVQTTVLVVIGTILTFVLNNGMNLGPIKASSMVGLLAAILMSEQLAVATLCGAFAGMAKPAVIPGGVYQSSSLVLGMVCAVMITLFDRQKCLVGIGGRLGFIAQLSCTTQFLISSMFATRQLKGGGAKLLDLAAYRSMTTPWTLLLVLTCISTITGALLMSAWKEVLSVKSKAEEKEGRPMIRGILSKLSTSVAAVSVTGLVMSIFPVSIAGPAFCGSLVAMSSPTKIETYGGLLGASTMAGISQILLTGALVGGWGGKLGTAALMGVLLYRTLLARFWGFSKSTPVAVVPTST
jgi:hypothetical protein